MELRVTVTVEALNPIGEPITTVSTTNHQHTGDNPRFTADEVRKAIEPLISKVADQVAVGTGFRADTMTPLP